eukprot:611266-Pyramimonas_sp.AAC.1
MARSGVSHVQRFAAGQPARAEARRGRGGRRSLVLARRRLVNLAMCWRVVSCKSSLRSSSNRHW